MAATDSVLSNSIEIIKDVLYMGFHDEDAPPPLRLHQSSQNYFIFLNDKSLVFTSFFADFGPLDLGLTYKFCTQLHETIQQAKAQQKAVLYSCSNHPHHRANGAVLICAYMIFVRNSSAERAYAPFMGISPPFITFRDAGFCISTFPMTVLDCARAMRKAVSLGHYSFSTFNLANFQHMAKLQNGDLSWIIPGKFIAFAGPVAKRRQLSPGVFTLTPEGYVPILKKLDVSCIIRFNSKCYDRNVYLVNGIRHVDLYYEDGGNPTEEILQAFLQICETERGAIAVHCKAGLGRTGTNIAAYMMKHYGYTAKETMAWCRLCRPGSIVGPQQQYLESIQERMFKEGAEYRMKHRLPAPTYTSASDERSVASVSGSVDGQLSAYTGVSVNGQGSISGLSASGGAHPSTNTSAGAGAYMGLSGSFSNERVATPPPLAVRSNSNRQKQATESLFRSAVSPSQPRDTDAHIHAGRLVGGGASANLEKMGQAAILPLGQAQQGGDLDLRRPATSGGLQYRTGNASPLRGSGGTMHSSSFSYGQHGAEQATGGGRYSGGSTPTGASRTPVQLSQGGVDMASSGLPVHRPHALHARNSDHHGGPGKSRILSGYPDSPAAQSPAPTSPFRPVTSQGFSGYAGNDAQGGRSASAARYGQSNGSSHAYGGAGAGAGASGSDGVTFYDQGHKIGGIGTGAGYGGSPGSPYQPRGGSAHRSRATASSGAPSTPAGDRLRLSGELGSRPGTSGGLRANGMNSPTSSYYQQSPASPQTQGKFSAPTSPQYASNGGFSGSRRADYPTFESYAQQPREANRPRTSGGVLVGNGASSAQGRSQSHGRSGLYKRRF